MIPKKLLDEISLWIKDRRYGNLQINFAAGRIVNVNRTESIKVEAFPVDNLTLTGTSTID